jgi:hypothetical protein
LLEKLNFVRLFDPTFENASHCFNSALAEFMTFATIIIDATIGLIETPNGSSTIDRVANTSDLRQFLYDN